MGDNYLPNGPRADLDGETGVVPSVDVGKPVFFSFWLLRVFLVPASLHRLWIAGRDYENPPRLDHKVFWNGSRPSITHRHLEGRPPAVNPKRSQDSASLARKRPSMASRLQRIPANAQVGLRHALDATNPQHHDRVGRLAPCRRFALPLLRHRLSGFVPSMMWTSMVRSPLPSSTLRLFLRPLGGSCCRLITRIL